MFEEFNMTRKLKRQLGSAISMVLTVAMLVTGLPADLLGGIASVKAAEFTANTNQQYVTLTYEPDVWVKSSDGLTESRVKKWDFSKNGPESNSTIGKNQQLHGIVVTSDADVSYKKWDGSKTEGFCIGKTGSVAILLDDATTKVEVGFNLYTNSSTRKINIGGVDVFQTAKNSDLTVAGTLKITDDDTYGHYLKIEGVSNGGDYSAEGDTKFNTLTITETRPVKDDSSEGGGEEDDDPVDPVDPDEIGTYDGIDPGEAGDMSWVFPVKEEDATVVIQKSNHEYYRGLKVDTSDEKAKLSFSGASNPYAQFNENTKILVPVDGNCEITVSSYNDQTNYVKYTIGDETPEESPYTYIYKGPAAYVAIVATANTYLKSIETKHTGESEDEGTNDGLDRTKPEVWDFGAEELEGVYNLFTVEVSNSTLYPNSEPGSVVGDILAGFTLKDSKDKEAVKFVTDKTNHRLRTTNTALTRKDDKSLEDKDGNVYTGYLYSNSGSTRDTSLDFYLYEGDTLTLMLGSNGNAALYNFETPDGEIYRTFDYTAAAKAEQAVFHAGEEGWYKLWCSNEKLVCARIIREHAPLVEVSGSIDVSAAEDIPDGYGILYTNQETGLVTEMTVENNSYTGTLYGGYTYKASLKGANGFVVKDGRILELEKDEPTVVNNLSVEPVDKKTITGKVEGLSAEALKAVKFVFEVPEDYVYEPELSLNRDNGEFTLQVENGVTYPVTALDVNDYTLTIDTISATEDKTDETITFEEKAKYEVTLNFTGLKDDTDTTKATVVFTNVDETYTDGKTHYTYTFTNDTKIELRDGSYSVKVTKGFGNQAVAQGPTANVKVNGAAASATVPFKELRDGWDFAVLNNTAEAGGAVDIEIIDETNYYAGLKLEGTVSENKTYLLANADAKITVPDLVEGDKLTVKYCYSANFKLGDKSAETSSGSTSTIEAVEYTVKESDVTDGGFVITANAQTYFCAIEVLRKADMVEYAETVNVGTDDGDYKTINEALAAVRKMDRGEENQRVTIMIAPGNYEEMLDIDVPNVTLKNAAEKPSIELTEKGVGIDPSAVRVTWYYGHGYTYYSMGPDSKFDAELLEVNKANGYASYVNTGSGTTNGSYWNATVTVQASGFRAEGIIFENSFNQYVSAASVNDVIEKQSGAKEGSVARATMKTVGDTKVQEKAYVERAAALAIYNNQKEIYFENCKFVGRQDTLYGGTDVTAAFYGCSIYGGTDYIFGGMTAVFAKCDLVFNTYDKDNNDVGYITAPQQKTQKGYLMYNCRVTSTTPGVDTISEDTSRPGYLGRPWEGPTSEAVFYATVIEASSAQYFKECPSLIQPVAWLESLSSASALVVEYDTYEMAMDVSDENFGAPLDNSEGRADWSGGSWKISDLAAATTDGEDVDAAKAAYAEALKKTDIETYLGNWDAFKDKDMEVEVPDKAGTVNNLPIGKVEDLALRNLGVGTGDGEDIARVEVTWKGLLKAEATSYKLEVTEQGADAAVKTDEITNEGAVVTTSTIIEGLTVGKTYVVKLTAVRVEDGVEVEGGSDTATIEVKAEEDEPVDPNEPTGTRFDLDLSEGLFKDQYYAGGFTVMEDMPRKEQEFEVAGTKYTYFVQGSTNAAPNKGEIPTNAGGTLVLDALEDGRLSIVCWYPSTNLKPLCFVDGTDGVANAIMKSETWSDKIYEFDVKKGHTYYFYADGSKPQLAAVWVRYATEVVDPNAPDVPVDPDKRTDWAEVKAPEVASATFEAPNKVVVKAKGDVSAKGADELVVVLKREGSAVQKELSSKVQTSAEQEFTFEVSVSGTYVATAYLVRAGESRKASESTKSVEVQLDAEYEQTGLQVELIEGYEYTYTGSAIKPAIEVTNNGEPLVEGVDYTVKYKNNVKAGASGDVKKSPSITVTGKGNLTGSNTTTFTIKQVDIGSTDVEEGAIVVASGSKATPVLVYNGVKLTAKDFINPDAKTKFTETKDITITGQGNFTGERVLTVTVVPKSELKKFTVTVGKEKLTYDPESNEPQYPTITVTDKTSKQPLEESDYIIVYNGDCVSAGTVKFTVIGLGLYSGTVSKSYKINPVKGAVSDFTVTGINEDGYDFKSAGVTFNDDLQVSYKGIEDLVLGRDYKVTYSGNKKAGVNKAKVKITFLGNYKGSKAITQTFTINPTPLSETLGEVMVVSADKVYSGKPNTYVSKPVVTVDGVALKASDYTVKYYKEDGTEINSKNKLEVTDGFAEVEVRVTGKGNYAPADANTYVTGTYKVTVVSDKNTQDLSKAKITFLDANGAKVTKLEYTGEFVEPYSVKVEIKGSVVPAEEYTVTYVNNVNKGKATAVINANDGSVYGGGKTASFSIVSKSLKNLLDLFN